MAEKAEAGTQRVPKRGPESTEAFNDYFGSQDFAKLCEKKGWGTDDHLRYRGFMFDKVTPLKNYLMDTLHASLNITKFFRIRDYRLQLIQKF